MYIKTILNIFYSFSKYFFRKIKFKGKGYYYSKYLAELEDSLGRLREKIQNDKKINDKLESVKTNRYLMPSDSHMSSGKRPPESKMIGLELAVVPRTDV